MTCRLLCYSNGVATFGLNCGLWIVALVAVNLATRECEVMLTCPDGTLSFEGMF